MDRAFFIMNLWRWAAGKPEARVSERRLPSLTELVQTEWSSRFEQLMRNRLILGAFRYGRFGVPGKRQYDRIASIRIRLGLYENTGNLEHLVDAANLLMLEFVEGDHPKKHFHALDCAAEHHTEAKL